MGVLKENPILGHITTFGGHPVSSVAGLASLNVLVEEDLVKDVAAKAELFRSLLIHPAIKEIRGIGLMMSIQLACFEQVEKVSRQCATDGLIIDWFLHCETALRIAPPLIITNEQIRASCAIILKAVDNL